MIAIKLTEAQAQALLIMAGETLVDDAYAIGVLIYPQRVNAAHRAVDVLQQALYRRRIDGKRGSS